MHSYDDILIIRFDAQLYFANVNSLMEYLNKKLLARPDVKHVILDFSVVSGVDSSAVHAIKELIEDLQDKDRVLYLSNVRGPVRDIFSKNKMMHENNSEHFYLSNAEAIRAIKYDSGNNFTEYVSQAEGV